MFFYSPSNYGLSTPNGKELIQSSDLHKSSSLAYKEEAIGNPKAVVTFQLDKYEVNDRGWIRRSSAPNALLTIAILAPRFLGNGHACHFEGYVKGTTKLPGGAPKIYEVPDDFKTGDKLPEKSYLGEGTMGETTYVKGIFDFGRNLGRLLSYNVKDPLCEAADVYFGDQLTVDNPELIDDGKRSIPPYVCRGFDIPAPEVEAEAETPST